MYAVSRSLASAMSRSSTSRPRVRPGRSGPNYSTRLASRPTPHFRSWIRSSETRSPSVEHWISTRDKANAQSLWRPHPPEHPAFALAAVRGPVAACSCVPSANGRCGTLADNRRPLANSPASHQTIHDVRVIPGEGSRDVRRIPRKQQRRAVDGLGQGTGENQLTPIVGGPGLREVGVAKRGASCEKVRPHVVEQQKMLHSAPRSRWQYVTVLEAENLSCVEPVQNRVVR